MQPLTAEKALLLAKRWRKVARQQKDLGHKEAAAIFYRWADEFQVQHDALTANKENDDASR